MAVVLQEFTAKPVLSPLNTAYQQPQRNQTGEPWGLLNHCEDSVAVAGTGAGDNAQIRLQFPLPQGFAYRLGFFAVTLRIGTAATSAVDNWIYPYLETYLAVSPQVASGKTTQLDIPCGGAPVSVNDVGGPSGITFLLGGNNTNAGSLNSANSAWPTGLPLLYGYGDAVNPTFNVVTTQANTGTFSMSYHAEFLAYNVEQVNSSGVHWSVPVTG